MSCVLALKRGEADMLGAEEEEDVEGPGTVRWWDCWRWGRVVEGFAMAISSSLGVGPLPGFGGLPGGVFFYLLRGMVREVLVFESQARWVLVVCGNYRRCISPRRRLAKRS